MDLFAPIRVGRFNLRNRFVMAPLARARNDARRVPTDIVAEYYAQRASAGLIVTEATSVSPLSVSRPGAAALQNEEQVEGWRRVADRVHAAGGLIFHQLYHLGRKSDPSRMPGGAAPVAPSAIAAKGEVNGVNGVTPFAVPRALEEPEIAHVVEEFRAAADRAKRAGMDGVEIHGANSYLLDQFLRDGANHRTDAWGGPVENRARLMLDVVDAVVSVMGRDRTGIRLSPHAHGDGISDSNPVATFGYVASELDRRGIACIHLVEAGKPGTRQSAPNEAGALMPVVRKAFRGALIVNGGYDRASADAVIESGAADLVAFGTLFIANPDLVARFRRGAPLNPPDPATFHEGGAGGYVDYPALA